MSRKFSTGMTLIELLVVVLVVAILASIAVPSYRSSVVRANRSEAKTQLLSVAAALERCYTQYRAYDAAGCTVKGSFPLASPSGKYSISGTVASDTFTLSATPQGGQTADTGCGTLKLDDTNQHMITGTKSVNECWGK